MKARVPKHVRYMLVVHNPFDLRLISVKHLHKLLVTFSVRSAVENTVIKKCEIGPEDQDITQKVVIAANTGNPRLDVDPTATVAPHFPENWRCTIERMGKIREKLNPGHKRMYCKVQNMSPAFRLIRPGRRMDQE